MARTRGTRVPDDAPVDKDRRNRQRAVPFNPKTMFKGPIRDNSSLFTPGDPVVGSRVCVACLIVLAGKGHLIKPPHTYVEGICRFQAPGVERKKQYEPGEEEFLAKQKKADKVVPF